MTTGTGTNNYVLGRGKVYFGPFKAGTQTPDGERHLGNCPDFKFSIKSTTLDHYGSTAGIKEKDDSIVLEVDRAGSIMVDDINRDNIAALFLGSSSLQTVVGQVGLTDNTITAHPDRFYQIGTSDLFPSGRRNLANVVVKNGATTYEADTDYTVDLELGRLYIIPGSTWVGPAAPGQPFGSGTIPDNTALQITFDSTDMTWAQVLSGHTAIEGALRFVADNPTGRNVDYFCPWARLTPSGDYTLVSDTWQEITFDLEILKMDGREAIYADGRKLA